MKIFSFATLSGIEFNSHSLACAKNSKSKIKIIKVLELVDEF